MKKKTMTESDSRALREPGAGPLWNRRVCPYLSRKQPTMTLYIILIFIALCAGMAISVHAFGTGGKRKRIFQDIYFTVEDVDGIGVLYTKTGE